MNKGLVVSVLRSARVWSAPAFVLGLLLAAAAQGQGPAAQAGTEPVPKFDKAYLSSAAAIASGEQVWTSQCRHCHGRAAYPGKAPKLSPGGLAPEFIYDRVTNGFGKMPPWKEVFTIEQRKGVVAYIKSSSFSP